MNELAINLSDFESILSKSHCSCHFINPHKTRIILWKEVKDEVVTYYLRLGLQKFISYPLTDKNGAVYWRFQDYAKTQVEETKVPQELDPITKFQQRQAQALHHDETKSAINHSE